MHTTEHAHSENKFHSQLHKYRLLSLYDNRGPVTIDIHRGILRSETKLTLDQLLTPLTYILY